MDSEVLSEPICHRTVNAKRAVLADNHPDGASHQEQESFARSEPSLLRIASMERAICGENRKNLASHKIIESW